MNPFFMREDKWSIEVEILEDPNGRGGFQYFGFVIQKFPD
jgi:hypothetical protein